MCVLKICTIIIIPIIKLIIVISAIYVCIITDKVIIVYNNIINFYGFNCTGSESALTEDDIDYYTSYSYPNFAIVEAYSTQFLLNISIVQDCKAEDNELFRIIAVPFHIPVGHISCSADVVIVNDCKFLH